MRYSASDSLTAERPAEAATETWLLLATTYGVIVSAALLLAVAERTVVYLFTGIVFCGAHALVVGPQGRSYLSRRAGQLLAIGALAFTLSQTYWGDVHLSFSAAHFLLLVQLIKLYEAYLGRDLRLIQVAALFEIVVAGVWAVDVLYLPAFVLAGLCLMANLMAVTLHPSAVPSPGSEAAGAPTQPAVCWRDFLAAFSIPAVVVLCGTVALFLLLPRLEGAARVRATLLGPLIGFSQNVSLREIGALRQSDRIALRAKFFAGDMPKEQPVEPPRLLMRGAALPVYRDGQWFGYGEAMRQSVRARPALDSDDRHTFASQRTYLLQDIPVKITRIMQKVSLESHSGDIAFALYRPVAKRGSYESPVTSVSHELRWRSPGHAQQTYEVLSIVPEFTVHHLWNAEAPRPAAPWVSQWAVPEQIRPLLQETAAEIERIYSPQSDYDRVVAVSSYLLDPLRFSYTLELPDYGEEDPIAYFLTQSRRGSCEQFSSALALVLRIWGIPTRLVVGFKQGERDRFTGAYIFRDKDAHAWVEVYFKELGWVEFDPTPGSAFSGSPDTGRPGLLTRFLAGIQSRAGRTYRSARGEWSGTVIGYGRSKQRQILNALRTAASRLAEQATWVFQAFWPSMPNLGLLQVVLLATLLTFLAMGVYLLAKQTDLIVRRRRSRARADKTLRFYEELLRVLRRKGLRRPPHVTPREFAQTAATQLVPQSAEGEEAVTAIDRITELYYRARFGRHALTSEEERQVREALASLRGARFARPAAVGAPPVEPT